MLPGPRLTERDMRLAIGILGVTQLAIGIWLAVAPNSFVDTIAPFGPADHHFLRDLAAFQGGLGITLLAAVGRPAWRVPVLFTALTMNALHTINHLFDIGGTDPGWLGYANFFSLLLLTGLYAFLIQESQREQPPVSAGDGRRSRSETMPA